jgi:hypothetical protein
MRPAWQRALANARLPLYDVHWVPAVVIQTRTGKRDAVQVGLADGRVMPLANAGDIERNIKLPDVILARLSESKGKSGARAELVCVPRCRARPWCWRARPAASWR